MLFQADNGRAPLHHLAEVWRPHDAGLGASVLALLPGVNQRDGHYAGHGHGVSFFCPYQLTYLILTMMNTGKCGQFLPIMDALPLISARCTQQGHLPTGGGGSSFHAPEHLLAMGTQAVPLAVNSVRPTRPVPTPAVSVVVD